MQRGLHSIHLAWDFSSIQSASGIDCKSAVHSPPLRESATSSVLWGEGDASFLSTPSAFPPSVLENPRLSSALSGGPRASWQVLPCPPTDSWVECGHEMCPQDPLIAQQDSGAINPVVGLVMVRQRWDPLEFVPGLPSSLTSSSPPYPPIHLFCLLQSPSLQVTHSGQSP